MCTLFKCVSCGNEKPHTTEFFDRGSDRADGSISLRKMCKACRQEKRIIANRKLGIKAAIKPIDAGDGLRECHRCHQIKELNEVNFAYHHRGKNFKGVCRECDREYHKSRGKLDYHRANQLRLSYLRHDLRTGRDNNLTKEFILEAIINRRCFYCGDNHDLGADRIDNSKGHTMDNVIPCCGLCNATRSNRFSVEEMIEIGKVIKAIKLNREVV